MLDYSRVVARTLTLSLATVLLGCEGVLLSDLAVAAYGQRKAATPGPYQLLTWDNTSCRAKGRFQDREYCSSPVIDRIVADGKPAIPVLISQITDSRLIAKPVYDFWPQISAGDLAYFILTNLFIDDTWTKSTMPELIPEAPCNQPGWVCWGEFRKRHSLKEIQTKWIVFWNANRDKIYWDAKARCFRLSSLQQQRPPN